MIDFNASAGLYAGKALMKTRQLKYQRFTSAAEAVRYAIEVMPRDLLKGSLLEVEEERFSGTQIHDLYASPGFPLERRSRASEHPKS